MKKIFFSIAALIAAAGCSMDAEHPINVEGRDKFELCANIVEDDTRVSIGGEKFTEVSWVAGDQIKLSSVAGATATLSAESSGKSNVRFVGEGDAKAELDTYYGVYGRSGTFSVANGVVTVNCAEQWGGGASNAALLVGYAENVTSGKIDMGFRPANALLHVTVSGVSSIAKAEFVALDGSSFATSFSYDITTGAVSHTADGSSIMVSSPSTSFFVSLPADLDMPNYAVRLTDGNGNVCTKAFAAKKFECGTTTRVTFEWTTPTVTLGAKSSYSYYLADGNKGTNANKFTDPTTIYFTAGVNGESCASTYANVQDAVIEDLGYEVDGVDYTYSAGQVSWDKAANSFVINTTPSYDKSWGNKTGIKAYIKVGGKKYYSSNTVWITGLPHRNDWFNSTDTTGWTTTGDVEFHDGYGYNTFYYYFSTRTGAIYSPSFKFPSSTLIQYNVKACYYTTGLGNPSISLITGITSGTSVPSSTQTKSFNRLNTESSPSKSQYTNCPFNATINDGQRVYITDDHEKDGNAAQNWVSIGSCDIEYRE